MFPVIVGLCALLLLPVLRVRVYKRPVVIPLPLLIALVFCLAICGFTVVSPPLATSLSSFTPGFNV
jgi:hypothetical protein